MAAKIPKQVSLFYFTCIGEDIWQCKCTQKRKQIANKGYSNQFLNAESNEILYPLLAVSPLQDEEDLSAESHYQFIATTLQIYNKTTSSVIAFVADNENLNGAIAKLMKVPMIGCASHRLNLAVNRYLSSYELILSKIQNLMVKLSSIKRKAKLKKNDYFEPHIAQ